MPGPPASRYFPPRLLITLHAHSGFTRSFKYVYNSWRHGAALATLRWPPILDSTSRILALKKSFSSNVDSRLAVIVSEIKT